MKITQHGTDFFLEIILRKYPIADDMQAESDTRLFNV